MIINSECLQAMKEMPDNSVDSIVTDPPYGLSFMGKKWDYDVPSVEIWKEALRVLKPGGMLLAFAGTRTQHRMAINIEDAGFEIRDMIAWIYGSGFPKSHNISKAIDKSVGVKRNRIKVAEAAKDSGEIDDDNPITEEAKKYEGWGTALKPALEPITVARKPLSEKTVAKNVLKWGAGGINIDECRVGDEIIGARARTETESGNTNMLGCNANKEFNGKEVHGRFPANLIHDGSEEVVELFPKSKSSDTKRKRNTTGIFGMPNDETPEYSDKGSNARFFYCAKASKRERNEGCEGFEKKQTTGGGGTNDTEDDVCGKYGSIKAKANNFHPTVKPVKLMQYLVRLVTPKGGTVLDPFTGSGSTGIACVKENFDFIGIEMDEEYCKIAEARIEHTRQT